MNKIKELQGFTLVELLAVIALVAILSSLAIANIVSSINNSKKNQFLVDAKRMISRAEYLISSNRDYRTIVQNSGSVGITFEFNDRSVVSSYVGNKLINIKGLNANGEFDKDADGAAFSSNTYVKVTYNSSSKKYIYCVYVEGSKRKIGTSSSCVLSTNLSKINIVTDK